MAVYVTGDIHGDVTGHPAFLVYDGFPATDQTIEKC